MLLCCSRTDFSSELFSEIFSFISSFFSPQSTAFLILGVIRVGGWVGPEWRGSDLAVVCNGEGNIVGKCYQGQLLD